MCKERRCRTHCRCGRRGSAKGRGAARPAPKASPKARAAPPASASPRRVLALPTPPPIGRPAALSLEVLSATAWWTQLLRDVNGADEIAMSSMVYDRSDLTSLLLRKLSRGSCRVVLVVDKEAFEAQPPVAPRQAARLRALANAGADVALCSGAARYGRLHGKALVCNRRVAYTGSANLTEKSSANDELCFCLRGPQVADILSFITSARARGRPLG